MIQIHLYTLIALFLFFLSGITIPAHLKFKNLTRQKFSGNYMIFHEASKNRKRLIMIFLISGTLLLWKYPLIVKHDFLDKQVENTFVFMMDVAICFFVMVVGGRIGNFLLKYFEDKK